MDKAQIIETLAQDKKLLTIAKNIAGSSGLEMDLYQHTFEALLNMSEAKLLKAYNGGYLQHFTVKIMALSFKSKKSPFAMKYRHFEHRYNIEDLDIECPNEIEKIKEREQQLKPIEDYINQPITQDNFFDITLIKQWSAGDSIREINKKTKIPMRPISASINKTLNELKTICNQ